MRMSSAGSAVARMEMGICFATAPFSLFFMFESPPSLCPLWRVIDGNGPVVCCGMVGFLV